LTRRRDAIAVGEAAGDEACPSFGRERRAPRARRGGRWLRRLCTRGGRRIETH
jgi:hypothetical protein